MLTVNHLFIETAACCLFIPALAPMLFIASLSDIRSSQIPDTCSLLIVLSGLCSTGVKSAGWACITLILFSFFAMREMLGWGDVKLIAAVSLHLGADIFRSLIIACILCLGYAVWKKESLPAEIPFAPFLCIGFMLYAGAG